MFYWQWEGREGSLLSLGQSAGGPQAAGSA